MSNIFIRYFLLLFCLLLGNDARGPARADESARAKVIAREGERPREP